MPVFNSVNANNAFRAIDENKTDRIIDCWGLCRLVLWGYGDDAFTGSISRFVGGCWVKSPACWLRWRNLQPDVWRWRLQYGFLLPERGTAAFTSSPFTTPFAPKLLSTAGVWLGNLSVLAELLFHYCATSCWHSTCSCSSRLVKASRRGALYMISPLLIVGKPRLG